MSTARELDRDFQTLPISALRPSASPIEAVLSERGPGLRVIVPRPGAVVDRAVVTLGILDQGLQGLLAVAHLDELASLPRSRLMTLIEVSRRLELSDNLFSQLSLTLQLGRSVLGLARDWREVLARPPTEEGRSYARLYLIASLTAASLFIPWLLLRRRSVSG